MPDSQAQVRWAHAVLEGEASGDKKFAAEVVDKMHGRKMSSLPERKKKTHLFGGKKRGRRSGS